MDEIDKKEVLRFLVAVEEGSLPVNDMFTIVEKFDPLLSYFLLKYLREKHPVTDRDSGAGSRLLELLTSYPELAKMANSSQKDPMVEWFSDSYSTKTYFNATQEFVDLIVDKMEG